VGSYISGGHQGKKIAGEELEERRQLRCLQEGGTQFFSTLNHLLLSYEGCAGNGPMILGKERLRVKFRFAFLKKYSIKKGVPLSYHLNEKAQHDDKYFQR